MILDSSLAKKIFEFGIIKLSSIIQDDDPWNVEPTNDVSLDEALDFCLCDSYKGFHLKPLGKIINCNK